MKKLLLTLIVSIAFCGSIFAQDPVYGTSYWPDFNSGPYETQGALVAAFSIGGEQITLDNENWNWLEVAAFTVNGDECRANNLILTDFYVLEWGDPDLITDALPIYYTTPGDEVYFRMFDHMNNVYYNSCTVTLNGEAFTIHTGEEHYEAWDTEPYVPIILDFGDPQPVGEGIDKDIVGYEPTDTWYFLSSPVGDLDDASMVTNMLNAEYDLYYFDQNADDGLEWRNYKVQPFGLEAGKGYLYAHNSDVTITFPGTAYDGVGTFELAYEAGAQMPGYNLMGNPYNTNATVEGEIEFYVMEGAEMVAAESRTVEPMQGILLIAESTDESVTFTPVVGGDKAAGLSLNVSNGRSVVDRAIVRFGQGRQLPKYQIRKESTKVYIPVDGEDYAVVRTEGMGELPVSFKAEKSGRYTISANSESVSFGYLHLIDNKTGADTDLLATPSYSFEASTTDYANRFKLVFATGDTEDSFAFYSNGSFVINNEGEAVLQVLDVTGRILTSESISGCASVRVDGAAGVYMIRLVNGENVRVQKVVVK